MRNKSSDYNSSLDQYIITELEDNKVLFKRKDKKTFYPLFLFDFAMIYSRLTGKHLIFQETTEKRKPVTLEVTPGMNIDDLISKYIEVFYGLSNSYINSIRGRMNLYLKYPIRWATIFREREEYKKTYYLNLETTYNSSLDRYTISEDYNGLVNMQIKESGMTLEFTVNVGILYSRITGKTVSIETRRFSPNLIINPKTTAAEAIEQFYTYDEDMVNIKQTNKTMQLFLKHTEQWIG